MNTLTDPAALARLRATFLSSILPRVVAHGRVSFRHIKCSNQREELLAEMTGICWRWHLRLAERGKDASSFPSALARFAVHAVRSGRRVCGQERGRDALSPSARRHGFRVSALPWVSTLSEDPLSEALADGSKWPPDQLVMFRLDFISWRASRTERDRRILEDLMVGERTLDVAGKYGLSAGRISQLRRELHDDWERFCAAPPQVV